MQPVSNHKCTMSSHNKIVLCVAGAKGAVGATVAAGIAAISKNPDSYGKYLITDPRNLPSMPSLENMSYTGWDINRKSLTEVLLKVNTISHHFVSDFKRKLENLQIFPAINPNLPLAKQISLIVKDISKIKKTFPDGNLVFINLLPATVPVFVKTKKWNLFEKLSGSCYQDLAYTAAAILCGLPIVNFTSNCVEIPILFKKAIEYGVPICGRDGKTGQTFIKTLIASALKARKLIIEGWYSTNILGNDDGKNLAISSHSKGKIRNKTEILEKILGYTIKSNIVRIDFYKPRGDAKEAWDVIDFRGFFDESMSLRINLLGKDSVLAAPLIIDLARIMVMLKAKGVRGAVGELAFFFKHPVGVNPPITFQDQCIALSNLLH